MQKKLSANKVAQTLDISVVTLNNWYRWYHSDEFIKPLDTPQLPEYEQHTSRGKRYWSDDDIIQLQIFQDWIPKGKRGVMGDLNAKFWGKRGKEIQARKNKMKP